MGQTHSVAQKLDAAIPEVWSEPNIPQIFGKYTQREHFLGILSLLMLDNGAFPLKNMEFKIWYFVKPDRECVIALVAIRRGVVVRRIEPSEGGKTYDMARRKFRQHVQLKVAGMLESVPNAGSLQAEGGSGAIGASPPPAYERGQKDVESAA